MSILFVSYQYLIKRIPIMRKYILISLILASTAANAQTFTCSTYDISQGNGKGGWTKSESGNSSVPITINKKEDSIMIVSGENSIVFMKDYNDYRTDDGLIKQNNNNFILQTSIQIDTNVYIPVKITYHCK